MIDFMCKETLINIQTGEELDWDKVESLKDNAMLKVRPELWCEWDFEKNCKLGFDVWKVTRSSKKRVWWICRICGELFDRDIINKLKSEICPYCSGRRIGKFNNLAYIYPNLAKEWHPTKNGKLTPDGIATRVATKVWWLGKCGHEWETRVQHRTYANSGCPYCSKISPKVLKGFNDIWTTNPDLALLLSTRDDGFKYTEFSNKKVNFTCPSCDNKTSKIIASVAHNGLKCNICSDGFSFGEKLLSKLLSDFNIEFLYQKKFNWSNNKIYDYYIPSINTIIEAHGEQHYIKGFETAGGCSLDEVRENDLLKEKLALNNGISKYIIINTSIRKIENVKNEILNSGLFQLLNLSTKHLIDYDYVISDSLVVDSWEYWKNGHTSKEIANILRVSQGTVQRYLNLGNRLNKIKFGKSQ